MTNSLYKMYGLGHNYLQFQIYLVSSILCDDVICGASEGQRSWKSREKLDCLLLSSNQGLS